MTTTRLQFIHLTDLHVDAKGAHHGIHAEKRLTRCIAHIAQHFPHIAFIAITGDLVERGDEASYRLVQSILSHAPCPVFITPGNHDVPQVMTHVFANVATTQLEPIAAAGLTTWTQVLQTPIFDAVFLNTHQPQCASGKVKADELKRLQEVLLTSAQKPVLLFMHHPPFTSGIACMDALGLTNAEALELTLSMRAQRPAGLFCGHLHRTISGLWHGIPVWCLRSTVQQVDIHAPDSTDITYCHEAPEYALVTVTCSNTNQTNIVSQTIRFTESETPCSCNNTLTSPSTHPLSEV